MKIRSTFVVAFVLALLLIAGMAVAKTPQDVLVIANRIDAVSLDPALAEEFTSRLTVANVYETLVRLDAQGLAEPGLASSWTVSTDRLTWTFNLRPEVRFASGNLLTAEDVRFSLKRAIEIGGKAAQELSGFLKPENVTVLDARTLVIKLETPVCYLPAVLAAPVTSILDMEQVLAHQVNNDLGQRWLRESSAGSGPYSVTYWDRGHAIVLEANAKYWGKAPATKQVVIKDIKEATTQKMLLENANVDIALDTAPAMPQQAKNTTLKTLVVPELSVIYLGMNLGAKPLDNVLLRQAIRFALDYNELAGLMPRGAFTVLAGGIPNPLLGAQDKGGVNPYNLDKAKKLLSDAGYADGFSVTLTIPDEPILKTLALGVESQLAKAKIKVNLQVVTRAQYGEMFRTQRTGLILDTWSAGLAETHGVLAAFGGTTGALAQGTGFISKEMEKLLAAASSEDSALNRRELYKRANSLLNQTGPWALLLQAQRVVAYRQEIKGLSINPFMSIDFMKISK